MRVKWSKRWMPTGPQMVFFLSVLLIADLCLLLIIKKNPLCFESSVIQEVQWNLDGKKPLSIYNCQAAKEVSLSPSLYERLSEIQKRISTLEMALRQHFPMRTPLKVSIFDDLNESIQVSSTEIKLSENYFFNRDPLLEKSYLKAWLQQNSSTQGLGFFQMETLTHFLLWNLGLENRIYGKWLPTLTEWPHMLTSWAGYCLSPVKEQIYTVLCLSETIHQNSADLTPLSLSLWFAHTFWKTFQMLSVSDQLHFLDKLPNFIDQISKRHLQAVEPRNATDLELFAVAEAKEWKVALEIEGFTDWGWNFASKIENEIETLHPSLGQVDLLVKKSEDWTPEELESFQALALEDTKYRIMGETEKGLWNFPWIAPVSKNAFPLIKAHHMVWLTCEWPSVESLLSISSARKVLLVKDCSKSHQRIFYSGLLHRGLQFFSLDNKDLQFILVNLEGLKFLSRQDTNITAMGLGVQKVARSSSKHFLSSHAKWASAIWNQQYRAYEVSAMVDAVEWFKLPENEWPELVKKE